MAVITMLLCVAIAGAVFAAGYGPLVLGLRAGDRDDDVRVTGIEVESSGPAVRFTAHNPGRQPVIVGASLRPRSLRSLCEGPVFVSVPRRTARDGLLAGRHAVVCALAAGVGTTLHVEPPAGLTRRAELVVAVGQADRLRVIHRPVRLAAGARADRPASPARPVQAWTSGSSSAYLPPESSVPSSG